MSRPSSSNNTLERLTLAQASRRFGLSVAWLRRLCQQGRLPHIIYGRTYTVDPNDVAAWLATCPQPGRPRKIQASQK